MILPPCRTGGIFKTVRGPSRYAWITSDLRYAVTFAVLWSVCPLYEGDGAVYRVEPAGPVSRRAHLEAVCSQAKVSEVVMTGVGVECERFLDDDMAAEVAVQRAAWRSVPLSLLPAVEPGRAVVVRR